MLLIKFSVYVYISHILGRLTDQDKDSADPRVAYIMLGPEAGLLSS